MNYAAFKTFLQTFLWRDTDTVLIAAMDNLILMANAGLSRKLKVQDAMTTVTLTAATDVDLTQHASWPADFRGISTMYIDGETELYFIAPADFRRRSEKPTITCLQDYYTKSGSGVYLPFLPTAGADVVMTYYASVPDYAAADASWVADKYLDLYVYAVLKEAGRFLRDDDRIADWTQTYTALLAEAIEDDTRDRYPSDIPLHMRGS
jgi:hypothetical protein